MIEITNKEDCCGCTACEEGCPLHCITMVPDGEGFLYPRVSESDCIHCNLCDSVCPFTNENAPMAPIESFAARNDDEAIRRESSSGGAFTALAERVIRNGGIVFGVRFNEQWQTVFDHTDNSEGLKAFIGSKYVQAQVGNTFNEVRNFLKQGRQVLFTGTPCQVAGLRHFLKQKDENLLTMDFICHGVPSPKVWERYLAEVTSNNIGAINDVQFRNKKDGWKHYNFVIDYNHAGEHFHLHSWYEQNPYMRAFLHDLILRPSCYHCKIKGGRSGSDLTMADFWGIDGVMPLIDDDKGISAIIANTERGFHLVNNSGVKLWSSRREDILAHNPSLELCAKPHPRRDMFFKLLDSTESIVTLIEDSFRVTIWDKINKAPKYLAAKFFSILKRFSRRHSEV